jgi:hypothetical protein
MKVALFEIRELRASLAYRSSPLEIKDLEILKDYIQDLIAMPNAIRPKGEVK